jgi:predicted Zn-dependent protease with MMP-like domain
VPLYRSRAQQFDDLVLEAVARLEPRWEAELTDVEFAVQEVPDADFLTDGGGVPLARVVRGSSDTSDPAHPASGPRIVLFRRPLLARAEDEDELSELVFDVVVEEFAEILGVDPETVDPGYGDPGFEDPGFGDIGLDFRLVRCVGCDGCRARRLPGAAAAGACRRRQAGRLPGRKCWQIPA